MKKILFLLIALPLLSFSQSQNPPSLKWKQITTNHFRVIYSPEIEQFAKQTAIMMDSFYIADTKIFINNYPKRVDLLLYNNSVVSNAYAALGPRRMVWYLTPPTSPSLTLSNWTKTLGIHEFRHITQYSQMNDGFTQLAGLVFGQYGWSAMSSWVYPNWFFEGDAVFNETKYSNSGRGRMPSFSLPLRTIYTNNEKISYEKALFRSYKTYYPNHYYLGYHMVSYINTHYGENIWNKIIKRTNTFSFWPYRFETSIKKYTGENVRKTYKKTFNQLDSIWTNQISELEITPSTEVPTNTKHSWTNYFDPQIINKDTLMVLKSGYDNNTTLCYLFGGKEKSIREISGEDISYSHDKVVWTTYKENIRYGEQSFNDILLYNLKTKKLSQITKKGKYFSAELSHSGDKIVAVKFGTDLIPKIVILDLEGNEEYSFAGNSDEFFMMPTWSSNDQKIVFLKTDINGESMIILDPETNEQNVILEPQWIKFDKPVCYYNYIFFNYDYTGITNIYAIDINTKQIYQVSSKPYASIQAVVDEQNSKIFFTEYQLNGLQISQMDYNPANWTPIFNLKQENVDYFSSDLTDESIQNIDISFAKSKADSLQSEDYKTGKHIFNVHSWSPMIVNDNMYGLELYSDNIMNTTNATIGAYADIYSNSIMADATINIKKYFPVFSLGISSGRMGKIYDTKADLEDANSNFWGYDSIANWNQNSANFGISIPLNLSKDIHYRYFNWSLTTRFVSISNVSSEFENLLDFSYANIINYSTGIGFTNRRYMNYRDLYPKFGQSFAINYSQTPRIFNLYGYKFDASADFYFPGIFNHHGIKISLDYEKMNEAQASYYSYGSSVSVPRGYSSFYFNKIKKLSINYTLPIWYPDINIPYILYVKRLRATIFYDYADVTQFENFAKISSTGIELNFDFDILRLSYLDFNAGVRFSYLVNNKKFNYQFLFLEIPITKIKNIPNH